MFSGNSYRLLILTLPLPITSETIHFHFLAEDEEQEFRHVEFNSSFRVWRP
jgi:hypothetical protein